LYVVANSNLCFASVVCGVWDYRKGEGIQQYICYKVNSMLEFATDPSDPSDPVQQSCVIRRFSDFSWLRETLEQDLPGLLIPALPDKALMGRFTAEFVEERRRALQLFLNRLMEHEIIKRHANVHLFLTGTDTQLTNAKNKGNESLKKTAGKTFMSLFQAATQMVQSAV
jgi:sorting nexin-1/2